MMRYKGADYPYLDETKDGWKIIRRGMDKYGMMVIIADRGDVYERYVVGVGYSPRLGYWGQGHYCETKKEAIEDWKEELKYPHFDPKSKKDLDFERMGKYNYNHVSQSYLRNHDYRDEDFDVYSHSDYEEYSVKRQGEEPGREAFDRYITKYNRIESYNKKKKKLFGKGRR